MNCFTATAVSQRTDDASPQTMDGIISQTKRRRTTARRLSKRVKGIEPSSSAWKAVALPLSYTRNIPNFSLISQGKWGVQDSNLRRQCHQIYSLTPLTARETPRTMPRLLVLSRSRAIRRPRASGGARTHDLRFTKPLLSQLSYASEGFKTSKTRHYIGGSIPCKTAWYKKHSKPG